jgi:hypothetical protein
MDEGQGSGSLRYAASIAVLVVTAAILGCGTLTMLPHPSGVATTRLHSLKDLAAAYLRVRPGETRASQLAALGFDATTANVEVLSYLGVIERFASDSRRFDRLDDALQSCIEARDRCTAFVFKPGDRHGHGGGVLASFGLGSANAASRSAEVTLLVQDGRVAYKTISGVPRTLLARTEMAMPRIAAPIIPRISVTPVADRTNY